MLLNVYKYFDVPESLSDLENYKHRAMNDPELAYDYAVGIIKGRWHEAEPYIKTSRYAAEYARDVIKGRWPEAEEYIKQKAVSSYYYARDVIKGRWHEAESVIKTSDFLYGLYKRHFNIE